MTHNFRKPRSGRRQTVDGILNAPSRPQLTGRPIKDRQLGGDSFRTIPRTIGGFERKEGYHVANSPLASPRRGHAMQENQVGAEDNASLLNMTLPGRQYDKDNTKRDKKRSNRGQGNNDKHKIRKYSLRGGIAVLALLVLLCGFLFTKGYIKLHKVFRGGGSAAALNENVAPALLKGEGDGRINILLLGRGGEGHDGADLTDTILVASIDPITKKAALVSIPRDTWVTTGGGSYKVNAVFANAKNKALSRNKDRQKAEAEGVKAVESEVEDILGVTIHYYGLIDFKAFQQAVDAVGGVDINITDQTSVTEKLWNTMTRKNYYLNVTPGKQHFDGERALFYSRSRHTSPRGDFDRAERQRVFLQALALKVASAQTYTNPVKVSQLMDAFGDHISTDMSLNDGMRLAKIGRGIGSKFDSIDLADPSKPLVKTGMINGQSVVLPVSGDFSEIQALVRGRLRDGYLAREDALVAVLNGTAVPGTAGQKAEELKSYGYNVGTVADAPTQDYTKTVVVDLSKGKKPYTKNYLQKRFSVKTTNTLPQGVQPAPGTSFVIVLGQQ
jgi:LCP family protein required for cell wall assembly